FENCPVRKLNLDHESFLLRKTCTEPRGCYEKSRTRTETRDALPRVLQAGGMHFKLQPTERLVNSTTVAPPLHRRELSASDPDYLRNIRLLFSPRDNR